MKILKWLLYLVLALVLIAIILGLTQPKTFDVSRSITINASKATVFPYLKSFEKMDQWSPWKDLDPNQKTEIVGTDGTVGAMQKWEGNKDVGKGEQTITAITENESVETHLKFLEPYESESDAYVRVEDAEEGTSKVTWGFKGENGFIERIMFTFMDFEGMIGKDFDKGLNRLKTLVETDAANKTYRGYKIEELDFPGATYIGVRKTLKVAEMEKFFGSNFGKLFGAAGDKVAGMPSALYFTWDEANQISDMAAVVPVKEAVPGFDKFDVPAGKALLINYYGAYDKVGDAHYGMDDYIKEKGYKQKSPVLEEYVTDPTQEPDTAKWLTKIMYFVE